jgi:hypothetical protein
VKLRLQGYQGYAIGCAAAWAVVWFTVLLVKRDKRTRGRLLLFFLGWVVGWTSATIARAVYPPAGAGRGANPAS